MKAPSRKNTSTTRWSAKLLPHVLSVVFKSSSHQIFDLHAPWELVKLCQKHFVTNKPNNLENITESKSLLLFMEINELELVQTQHQTAIKYVQQSSD